jgi:hypothetical protein
VETIPYTPVGGHLVTQLPQGRFLVDTGSPSSIGDGGTLVFAGERHSLCTDYLGATASSLANSVGTPLDGLIGTDILNRYDTVISPREGRLIVSSDPLDLEGTALEIDWCQGIPIVETAAAGRTLRAFFDTGAWLSYLDPELARQHPRCGHRRDFHPGLGTFETDTYRVSFTIGGRRVELLVGVLPEILRASLMLAGTAGILGTEILEQHRVLYAPRRNRLVLQPFEP